MNRAVVDTNVLVSAFLAPAGTPGRLLSAWREQRFIAITSPQLVSEYRRILGEPRLTARFLKEPGEVTKDLDRLLAYADEIELEDIPPIAGDPGDDVVLATAVAGSAAYVVTGDKPLLALGQHRGVRLLPPAVFLAVLPPYPPRPAREAP